MRFLLLIVLLAVPAEACSGWVLWRYTMAPRGYTHASVRNAFETKKECDAAAPDEAVKWAAFMRTRSKTVRSTTVRHSPRR
jgi:hypothetical protein